MRSFRLVVIALVVLIGLAEPLALVASAARLRPSPAQGGSDSAPISRASGPSDLANALDKLVAKRRSGTPFAIQEIEILDAWSDGLEISTIEARVLVSRAIYERYVAGTMNAKDEPEILARWRAYALERAVELQVRNLKLNPGLEQRVMPPDNSDAWRLYSDPELYNRLSSASQRRLERRFGLKGKATRLRRGGAVESASPSAVQAPPPNTLVNNRTADATTADTQSETSIVLGAGNTILSSFNDSGSNVGGAAHFTGIARSTDLGNTWLDQGTLPNDANGDAGDPVYARNNTNGTVILATLGFNNESTLPIFRSTTDGASYSSQVDGDGNVTAGFNDKEWVTCDNAAGAGQGNFYHFWRDFNAGGGMSFTRSTNDGVNWSNRLVLSSAEGQGAWVTVGADHAVYCFWLNNSNNIVRRKSTDQGVTFGASSLVQDLRTTGINGSLGLNGGFRTNAFPQVVTHPTDPNQLYMTWNDVGISPSTDDANVYFTQSTDGGVSWSAPVQVNTDATTNDQWQPVIAITPDGTGLFISWYDRRLTPANSLIDVYGRNATISGTTVTFGPDYRITDASFPVVVGQDGAINPSYMGDYDQAVADNTNFYRTWADNRLSLLTHANQPDVRFTKIPKAGPGAIVAATTSALIDENCTPDNNAIDPNETVTVSLTVRNDGTAATTNLVGTLQATGGVTSPNGPLTYGAVNVGASASQNFTFTANGSCGGTITASLQLQDGATNLGTVTYSFFIGVPGTQVFANAASITINDSAAATPYPSTVTVAGVTTYTRVTLSLNNLTHTFPGDIDIIVVAPGGQKAYVMSDVGGGGDVSGVNLVFDDAAAATIGGSLASGTFKPSETDGGSDAFPGPAPGPPYATTFGGFNGLGAAVNGTWSLFVRDDAGQDVGTIAGGWSINFVNPPTCSSVCGGGNVPPVANAGTPQSVNACTMVTLDGTLSVDPDAGPSPLTYSWTQTAGPTVVINNPTSAMPTFEAPNNASMVGLTFQLTVSDGVAMSSDTVDVMSNHVNGVHVDTVGIHVTGNNDFFLRNCNGPGPADIDTSFGANGTIPLSADLDGNGVDTPGAFDTVTRTFFFRDDFDGGAAEVVVQFGPVNSLPLVGDWDGNGTVTIGVYQTTTRTFFLKNTLAGGSADITITFGPAGATPLVGDWDGDGSTTIAVYVPTTGTFFYKNTNDEGPATASFRFGAANMGLLPVVGNWDGLTGDSVGVYQPATGYFFLKNSLAGGNADIKFRFGAPGSFRPLGGNWDGF